MYESETSLDWDGGKEDCFGFLPLVKDGVPYNNFIHKINWYILFTWERDVAQR